MSKLNKTKLTQCFLTSEESEEKCIWCHIFNTSNTSTDKGQWILASWY